MCQNESKPMAQLSTPAAGRKELTWTWPFFVVVTVVIAIAYVSSVRTLASLTQPWRLVLFTALMVLTAGMYWLSPVLIVSSRRRLAFFIVLAAATFTIGWMTPGHWLVLGLYPPLIGAAIGAFWPDVRSVAVATVLALVLLVTNVVVGAGVQHLVGMLPFVGLSLAFVLVYVVLFIRQVHARLKAQSLLDELETAHRRLRDYADQVEQLTLAQERERMGRELHDTLAQGVAGLMMKLEAIDAHLEDGNLGRAREVLGMATELARKTHHEARRAIQALRASALEHGGLVDAIRRETDQFEATTGVACRLELGNVLPEVSADTGQEILRVVQESLSNIARHARASQVVLRFGRDASEFRLEIEDDGIGFDQVENAAGFGLSGMRERAKRIGGTLRVVSRIGEGTKIDLVAPGGDS
jgi:NarL family two-component system sensor histidine kinase YdfH